MIGFVVFRDHDMWFKYTFDHWWDDPTFKMDGQRVDTRVEIQRVATRHEAEDMRTVLNMMMHKRPYRWAEEN